MEPKYIHYVVCSNPFCKAAFHEVGSTSLSKGHDQVMQDGIELMADFTTPARIQDMTKEDLNDALSTWMQQGNPNSFQAVKLHDVINNGLKADSIIKAGPVDTNEAKSLTAEETACKLIQRLIELNVLSEHAHSILEDEFNNLSTGEVFKAVAESEGTGASETYSPDVIKTLDAQYMEAQIRKLNAESHKLELANKAYAISNEVKE